VKVLYKNKNQTFIVNCILGVVDYIREAVCPSCLIKGISIA
jgi:hypothetical protein